jgi:hypothetical protein
MNLRESQSAAQPNSSAKFFFDFDQFQQDLLDAAWAGNEQSSKRLVNLEVESVRDDISPVTR